jgi:hypothetical protein
MKPVLLLLCLGLAACDQLAELDGSKAAEADGKAVGGACRHAGRALEDCYALNERASKSAVFNGWREMNDYMTQNKIEVVPPLIPKKARTRQEDPTARPEGHADALAPKDPTASKDAAAAKTVAAAKLPGAPKEKESPGPLQLPAGIPPTTPDKQAH